jgi:predicted alpha-1,2-mannosidase
MKLLFIPLLASVLVASCTPVAETSPVDYVNPYMGNISHLLVPTYPTVHLPNSMLRVYPERADFTGDVLHGLPLVVTSHRGASAFNLSPRVAGEALGRVTDFSYDHEVIKPYYYGVRLDEQGTEVRFAPSHRSAVYEIDFSAADAPSLVFNAARGGLTFEGGAVSGWQQLEGGTRVYLHAEFDTTPVSVGALERGELLESTSGECLVVNFAPEVRSVRVNYGISFIDTAQARDNLQREAAGKSVDEVAAEAKRIWNEALGKIEVEGDSDTDKTIFYTSLYRVYERPVCISEYGRYFSAFDGAVHDDGGVPFYTDDWIWDTYRAAHPLRILIDPATETDILRSFIRMAEQMPRLWMPTFPEITGDSRRMNSNHAVISFADAIAKGLDDFDLATAYEAARQGIMDKTLAPWSGAPAGELDRFYHSKGYIPALPEGETETIPEVHSFEKRQPVAVTLGTSYDQWALGHLASALGKEDDAAYFGHAAWNYRNVFNPATRFFHPRDSHGEFLSPFDYRFSGGLGAREAYGENNGWVYRWDVQHHLGDLVSLMGGAEEFDAALDRMYREPLGEGKYHFYAHLPDHTGNVGQFSMANEPSMHIPYLYLYAGKPWKTQKRIHTLLRQWFRNDLMGMPGDEDGGGMSAFVVFSTMGFYPVTPGIPMYVIGSPFFRESKVHLADGKTFTVSAPRYSAENKYIQSATLNGEPLDRSWFTHEELMQGGELVLEMGPTANHSWAAGADKTPPTGE